MKTIDRKAAVAAYKKRKAPAGIYTLTCAAAGKRWIGHAPDLDALPNRLWFTLRMGSHRSADLQAVYDSHGQDGISIERVEVFAEDDQPEGAALKERLASWRHRLAALPL